MGKRSQIQVAIDKIDAEIDELQRVKLRLIEAAPRITPKQRKSKPTAVREMAEKAAS